MTRIFLFSIVLLQSMYFPSTILAQGKKGSGSTTLPNVRFEVQFLGTLEGHIKSAVNSMNEAGEIVGTSDDSDSAILPSAVRFTPFGPIDLNVEMADLLAARDDGPWHAYSAVDINDLGQIVGMIKVGHLAAVNTTHTFFYDPGDAGLGRPRKLDILPLFDGTSTRPKAINNFGQIVGTYTYPSGGLGGTYVYSPGGSLIDMGTGIFASGMNDLGQIAFQEVRYTPNAFLGDAGVYETFPFLGGNGNIINSSGAMTGGITVTTSSKKNTYQNTYQATVYRASTPDSVQVLFSSNTQLSAQCINDDGDVLVSIGLERPALYTDMNSMGLLNLDPIVVGTSEALSKWREHWASVIQMTRRIPVSDNASFPMMAGTAGLPNQAFVLIPRLP